MKSVDTNLLVRFVLQDDERQANIAREILAEHCFAPATVFLELAWVVQSRGGADRKATARTLHTLLELPTLAVERADQVRWAIDRFVEGADLADMLHLIASAQTDAFVTFDRSLARLAGRDTPVPVETLR